MLPAMIANSARATVLALLVSGFTATTSAIPRGEFDSHGLLGRALICFYRGLDWESAEQLYSVRVHDEMVGGLSIGSYLYHLAEPGRRIVFVEAEINVSRSFQLRSGEIYYVQIARRGSSALSRPKLLPVDSAIGMRELARLSYAGSDASHAARQFCLRNDAS